MGFGPCSTFGFDVLSLTVETFETRPTALPTEALVVALTILLVIGVDRVRAGLTLTAFFFVFLANVLLVARATDGQTLLGDNEVFAGTLVGPTFVALSSLVMKLIRFCFGI